MIPLLPNLLANDGIIRLIRGRHGYFAVNRHDTVVGRSLQTYGEYFETEVALFRQLCRPGDVVVDVGANIGAHTVALAGLVGVHGQVHAYEAQAHAFQLLCTNVSLNSLFQVSCNLAAVGAEDGITTIRTLNPRRDTNFGGLPVSGDGIGQPVPLIRLDRQLDVPALRLIKVDVEGMERQVIAGASELIRRHRPFLYVENDRPAESPPLIRSLLDLGYRLYWHTPLFFNPKNFAGCAVRIHEEGLYLDRGNVGFIGFSINLLCVPVEVNLAVPGMTEVTDPSDHILSAAALAAAERARSRINETNGPGPGDDPGDDPDDGDGATS